MEHIWLSPPDVGTAESDALLRAFHSGWIAPAGPELAQFEAEVAARVGVGHAAAVSSGTAALHLALRLLGVRPGDEVWCSTLTFAATASPAVYLGAQPVFVDVDAATWQLDPALLEEALEAAAHAGRLPRAVVTVDLYGQCADYDPIIDACERFGVPIVEDAAEALGATYQGRPAGSFGAAAVLSFNGNKIITTSGGGMLVSDNTELIARARHLATQAREPALHYEHSEVGYNYRLSNLLAALGRAQLASLDMKLAARRANNEHYRQALEDMPGIAFMPAASYGEPSCWLTCLQMDPADVAITPDAVCRTLERAAIETRPVWKPLHLQRAFAGSRLIGSGRIAEQLFARGLCLPSGSSLTHADRDRVVAALRRCLTAALR